MQPAAVMTCIALHTVFLHSQETSQPAAVMTDTQDGLLRKISQETSQPAAVMTSISQPHIFLVLTGDIAAGRGYDFSNLGFQSFCFSQETSQPAAVMTFSPVTSCDKFSQETSQPAAVMTFLRSLRNLKLLTEDIAAGSGVAKLIGHLAYLVLAEACAEKDDRDFKP